ncbi:MAG: aldehyde dehydrogenase family protein [Spirochaetaceae bacterium]|nr:aldehyde dehydrogenase family protein [Spirochaetaceae bacterium]
MAGLLHGDRIGNWIDGRRVDPANGEWLESVDPSVGKAWIRVPGGDAQDVDHAVAAAKAAFSGSWRSMPATQRAGLLRAAAVEIGKHAEELATIECRDNGKPLAEAIAGDLPSVVEMMNYWAGAADKIHGETIEIGPTSHNFVRHEPLGVVGIIVPWNSPLAILAAKVGAALAAGNCVVLKPAEQAAASILTIAACFDAAGFPHGVVNVVSGLGEVVGDALVRHPDVRKIAMTGSTETARRISERAAPTLKQLAFELGGKSPNIVFADADLELAVPGASTSAVFTGGAGQTCVAGSRLLVHASIYDDFLERVERHVAKHVRLGNALDRQTTMGPIAFAAQYEKVKSYVELGRKEGAEIAFGGRFGPENFDGREEAEALAGGYFVSPTLFRGATNDMRVCREEIFGPVTCAIPFHDDDEALAIANDTHYGLAAGVWTRDLKRAHRFVRDLEAGAVWVNAYRRIHWAAPFGGYKESGYGRDSGLESLRGYQQTKTAWIDLS